MESTDSAKLKPRAGEMLRTKARKSSRSVPSPTLHSSQLLLVSLLVNLTESCIKTDVGLTEFQPQHQVAECRRFGAKTLFLASPLLPVGNNRTYFLLLFLGLNEASHEKWLAGCPELYRHLRSTSEHYHFLLNNQLLCTCYVPDT